MISRSLLIAILLAPVTATAEPTCSYLDGTCVPNVRQAPEAGSYTTLQQTIVTANVSQTVLAANPSRKAYTICNTSSATMSLNYGAPATATTFPLANGTCVSNSPSFITNQAITGFGGTAGQTFFTMEGQ